MKFISTASGVHFEIVRNEEANPHSDCTVRAEIQTAFGNFSGENTAVHFSAFDIFRKRFHEFLETRQGEVVLEMTEDTSLTFFRWNAKGDVGVRFTLSRYAYLGEPMKTCPIALRGEFPIDGEYLNRLPAELSQLAER